MKIRIGVDLGGTKIEAVALGSDGRELLRRRVATPRGDYRETLSAVAMLVESVEREAGSVGTVGLGIPGTESRATGLIKNANSTWLNGKPLRRDVESLLKRKIRVANDANCFALSEAVDGAAAGASVVFGIILGTGVGAGIVVHGKVLEGCNGIAGEWGHNQLPLPNEKDFPLPACYCGRLGCNETYLSGPGLAADHHRVTGQSISAAEIAGGARAGDEGCADSLTRYIERLSRGLATVINVLDPDVIVVGGGLSNIERLYDEVTEAWKAWIFSDEVLTRLVANKHGDSSGVRGAAWLWD